MYWIIRSPLPNYSDIGGSVKPIVVKIKLQNVPLFPQIRGTTYLKHSKRTAQYWGKQRCLMPKKKKIKMADVLGLKVKNTKILKLIASLHHTSNLTLKSEKRQCLRQESTGQKASNLEAACLLSVYSICISFFLILLTPEASTGRHLMSYQEQKKGAWGLER